MKFLFFFFSLLFIFAASSCTQSKDWLRADKSEFKSILPYFDTIITPFLSERYKKMPKEITIAEDISVGKWVGVTSDAVWRQDSFELTITQVHPFIKGTYTYFKPPSADVSGAFSGPLRGKIKDDGFIIVCQKGALLFYLEGKCFNSTVIKRKTLLGNFSNEYEVSITKGNFTLEKVDGQ